MRNCSSVQSLSQRIFSLMLESPDNPMIILVGGCSRVGKTVLVSKLREKATMSGINSVAAMLDSWLVSLVKRKDGSSVLERYETEAIAESINKLNQGQTIYPPVYDPVSRRRIAESSLEPISIKEGILFVEGVVALAIENLLEYASLRIFVDIPDKVRKKRLIDFYANVKKLPKEEYSNIIGTRESEEVFFVKRTAVNADVIFDGMQLM